MRKVPRPDKSVPFLEADGITVSQAWFDFLGYLNMRGIIDAPDVDASAGVSTGQVLVYDGIAKKFLPGTN